MLFNTEANKIANTKCILYTNKKYGTKTPETNQSPKSLITSRNFLQLKNISFSLGKLSETGKTP